VKNVRLIEILKTFSDEELKSFRKFLSTPFNKSRRNIGTLLNYVMQLRPDYDTSLLENQSIQKTLFPEERYDEKKIMNLIADLTRAAKDFLIHKAIEDDEIQSLICLCGEYYKRKLLKNNYSLLKTLENKLEPEFSEMNDYYSGFRKLNALKNAYYNESNDYEKIIECETEYFVASATQFIIDYTKFLSTKKPALSTYGMKMENHFAESVLESFDINKLIRLTENENFINTSLITLHYYRFKTIKESDNIEHYYSLKEYFYKILPKLNRKDKHFIFSHMENYCVIKVREGKEEFKREGFEVYKTMLENNAYSFSESEYMQVLTFRNIIYYCNMLNETEWLKYLTENYITALNPDYREDMRNFTFAIYYFGKKDFVNALGSISKKFDNEFFLFKTDVKNLMLQIYFELNHIEQAFSLVDSYKHFLSTSREISESHKEVFNNFLKHYFELLKLKAGQSKENPLYIKSKIGKEKSIINRVWLVEKTEELII
jgi:hypothetical protein